MLPDQLIQITTVPRFGGSGGATIDGNGGAGGGAFGIFSQGAIDIDGTIRSNGENGSFASAGGGGGGFILVVSATRIEGAGTIQARGGRGADRRSFSGGGGGSLQGAGGGGGIVHLLAPVVDDTALTVDVAAGPRGTPCGSGFVCVGFTLGAGGGASGGDGGSNGLSGQPGVYFRSLVNPSSLP